MKKEYKLSIRYDDKGDKVDSLSEDLTDIYITDEEEVWLDTGEKTIRLPKEVAEYIESNGILGMA